MFSLGSLFNFASLFWRSVFSLVTLSFPRCFQFRLVFLRGVDVIVPLVFFGSPYGFSSRDITTTNTTILLRDITTTNTTILLLMLLLILALLLILLLLLRLRAKGADGLNKKNCAQN